MRVAKDKMLEEKKRFYTGISVLVGASIGAGILGIPYVAAQAGFFVALSYILVLGLIIMTLNLYLGEVSLRTKGKHQLAGYAEKYLGKKGKFFTEFAFIFGVYSALIAYMLGMGESFSYLFFENTSYSIQFGALTGLLMSGLLWRGLKALKRFERVGVSIVLFLLFVIFFFFVKDVRLENLTTFNSSFIFLPFGVVLFAFLSFHAIPDLKLILKGREEMMKKIILSSTLIIVVFYSIFTFIVVGFRGLQTPEVATLALGKIFVFLGLLTMFTSYLALGNALRENFSFDDKMKRKKSWLLSAILPIFIFIFLKTTAFDFFSFTKILSIGGVISGGAIAIVSLLMVRKAKIHGNRKPEYSVPINWFVITILSLVFIFGIFGLFQVF